MKIKENYAKDFFWVCFKIGIGVLVYRYGLELFGTVAGTLIAVVQYIWPDAVVLTNVVVQLATGASSVAAFAAGAVAMFVLLKIGKSKNYQKVHKRIKMPWTAPFMVVSVVAINFVFAELNAFIMAYLTADGAYTGSSYGTGISIPEMLTMAIATAVVPAICEELAFRGIILTNLDPYGKGTAILGSALLFGLMHMNPAQFLYTTVMGIMLGLVYVKTKSIWLCMVIHFVNNGLSVIQDIVYYLFDADAVVRIMSVMTLTVTVLGIVSMLILILARRHETKRAPEEIGSFGRIYDSDFGYEARPVTFGRKLRLFFSPTVLVFTATVLVTMALMAVIYIFGFILPPISL